jgi:hypothetical protein
MPHRVQLIAHQPANSTTAAADYWGPVLLIFLFTVFLAICLVTSTSSTVCGSGWLLLLLLLACFIIIISRLT